MYLLIGAIRRAKVGATAVRGNKEREMAQGELRGVGSVPRQRDGGARRAEGPDRFWRRNHNFPPKSGGGNLRS